MILLNYQKQFAGKNITSIPTEIGAKLCCQRQHNCSCAENANIFSLAQLGNLQQLNLCNNKITSIPPEIGQLGNLQWLYLYNNEIVSIPPEISQLNLQELSLRDNK